MTYEDVRGRAVLSRMLRERYTPTPMPAWVGPLLSLVMALAAINRGADFWRTAGRGHISELLAYVDLIGLRAWGWLLIVGGFATIAAFLTRWLAAVVITHMVMCGVYMGLAICYVQGQLTEGDWYGTRFTGPAVAAALVWGARTVILSRDIYRPRSDRGQS